MRALIMAGAEDQHEAPSQEEAFDADEEKVEESDGVFTKVRALSKCHASWPSNPQAPSL